jgi:prepilin-type processing-associated H-X9-DG protein
MPAFIIIEFPSNLGLKPSGVEQLPDALRRAGLHEQLGALRTERVDGLAAHESGRPADTGVLNAHALRTSSRRLAEQVAAVVGAGDMPLVLAGDCSVILGALTGIRWALRAQRRSDRIGLLFVDGHVTGPQLQGFWQHFDADALDDDIMPAVDYRQPGGMLPSEIITLLRRAVESRSLAGVSVAIYNPTFDPDGRAGRALVECVVNGLASA